MKPKTPKPIEKPLGPLQARILAVLQKKEATAAQILEALNSEPGIATGELRETTLASVRDALYRGLVKKKLVTKLPVAFAVVRGKK